jgi:hypothetical protein
MSFRNLVIRVCVNVTRFSLTGSEGLHHRVDKEGYYVATCLAMPGYHKLNTVLENGGELLIYN